METLLDWIIFLLGWTFSGAIGIILIFYTTRYMFNEDLTVEDITWSMICGPFMIICLILGLSRIGIENLSEYFGRVSKIVIIKKRK